MSMKVFCQCSGIEDVVHFMFTISMLLLMVVAAKLSYAGTSIHGKMLMCLVEYSLQGRIH